MDLSAISAQSFGTQCFLIGSRKVRTWIYSKIVSSIGFQTVVDVGYATIITMIVCAATAKMTKSVTFRWSRDCASVGIGVKSLILLLEILLAYFIITDTFHAVLPFHKKFYGSYSILQSHPPSDEEWNISNIAWSIVAIL